MPPEYPKDVILEHRTASQKINHPTHNEGRIKWCTVHESPQYTDVCDWMYQYEKSTNCEFVWATIIKFTEIT